MTKTQVVRINKIANEIKDLEVTPADEKIYKIVHAITQERKKQNLSQEELAGISGLTKNTISRIETFVSTPTLSALIQILYALNYDIEIIPKKNTNWLSRGVVITTPLYCFIINREINKIFKNKCKII